MKNTSISQRPVTTKLIAASSTAALPSAEVSTAEGGQKLFRRSIGLLPVLARRGVAPCDALAIAFNAAFLYYNMPRSKFMISPKAILRKYSYAEIASLCEQLLGTAEFAVNQSFKEVLP